MGLLNRECFEMSLYFLLLLFHLCLSDLNCQGSGRLSPASCAWSCQVKEAETGVCDPDGNCLCSGELEDPDEIFENDSDDSEDVRGLPKFLKKGIFIPLSRNYVFRSRSNLMRPSYFDLPNALNFYIPVNDDGDALGAWYIWPPEGPASFESLSSKQTLVVYMHGNSKDRGFSYRVSLYKLLTSLGYHILTFDYRDYGDSSPVSLSETTTDEDGKAVFRWVEEMVKPDDKPRIVLWGHSLGTAIATRTLMDIQEDGVHREARILNAKADCAGQLRADGEGGGCDVVLAGPLLAVD